VPWLRDGKECGKRWLRAEEIRTQESKESRQVSACCMAPGGMSVVRCREQSQADELSAGPFPWGFEGSSRRERGDMTSSEGAKY